MSAPTASHPAALGVDMLAMQPLDSQAAEGNVLVTHESLLTAHAPSCTNGTGSGAHDAALGTSNGQQPSSSAFAQSTAMPLGPQGPSGSQAIASEREFFPGGSSFATSSPPSHAKAKGGNESHSVSVLATPKSSHEQPQSMSNAHPSSSTSSPSLTSAVSQALTFGQELKATVLGFNHPAGGSRSANQSPSSSRPDDYLVSSQQPSYPWDQALPTSAPFQAQAFDLEPVALPIEPIPFSIYAQNEVADVPQAPASPPAQSYTTVTTRSLADAFAAFPRSILEPELQPPTQYWASTSGSSEVVVAPAGAGKMGGDGSGYASAINQVEFKAAPVERDDSSDLGSWSTAMAAAAAAEEGIEHLGHRTESIGEEGAASVIPFNTEISFSGQHSPSPSLPSWVPFAYMDAETSSKEQPPLQADLQPSFQPPSSPSPPPVALEMPYSSLQDPPSHPSQSLDPSGQPPLAGRGGGAGGGRFAWLFGTPAAPYVPASSLERADAITNPHYSSEALSATAPVDETESLPTSSVVTEALAAGGVADVSSIPQAASSFMPVKAVIFDSFEQNGHAEAQDTSASGISAANGYAAEVLYRPINDFPAVQMPGAPDTDMRAPASWETSFSTSSTPALYPTQYPWDAGFPPAPVTFNADPISSDSSKFQATREMNPPIASWTSPVPADVPLLAPKPLPVPAETTSYPWSVPKPDPIPAESSHPESQAASPLSKYIKHDTALDSPMLPMPPPQPAAPASPDSLPPFAPSQRNAQQQHHPADPSLSTTSNHRSVSSSYLLKLADEASHRTDVIPPTASSTTYASVSKPSASFLDAYLDNMMRLDGVGQASAVGTKAAENEGPDGANIEQQPEGSQRGGGSQAAAGPRLL